VTPANDNGATVRGLALPVVGLGSGAPRGAAPAITKGGGVDHGCRLNLTRAPASSGKFYSYTGAAARAAYLVNWATRRGRRVDVLA
jgi:hypothetical protein